MFWRFGWRYSPSLTGGIVFCVLTLGGLVGCSNYARQTPEGSANALTSDKLELINAVGPKVKAFCSDCHAMPRPTSSPADEWEMEIIQGFDLYRQTGRTDLDVPDQINVERYFKLQAPDKLTLPLPSTLNYPPATLLHQRSEVSRKRSRPPGVTHLGWFDLQLPSSPGHAILYCDIGLGTVNAYWPNRSDGAIKRLATLLQPVHIDVCDLDGDGRRDLLVADIGEFNAADSDLGRMIWLQAQEDETFKTHVLVEGLSRPSDIRAGDFDNDGDMDVLCATFGWRNSGHVFLLVNQGNDENGVPTFESKEVDPRHGTVHLPPIDFDSDGDLDFIALISQEHERVELFRNDGQGNFANELIWAAPDPAYGSSGIEIVDMDGDQDFDILYTNGDSFDRGAKPFHSVQWLENEGRLPMKRHEIGLMPGVLNATAGDFDSDGDMDVVAVALLPRDVSVGWVKQGSSPLVLYTCNDDGSYTPSRLEGQFHDHLSVIKGDFNGDGKLDFATGSFFRVIGQFSPKELEQPELLIWQSQ
ncbi:FG-GAP repeat domain-containing protein [Roseiconus lacunae]|uniref:FG-GAP repeat domain-containing protein n=1 Tax=Roseiconus lacunae TaxID=2605694 RepID=UPI001E45D822|nr:VCBS repeat-containing protein [Roseiconus lacunae]MCD0460201.1 VCBS repeat-containing protein [Roseiconus lacunae]